VADGVHRLVERVQPPNPHAVGDLPAIQAEGDELSPGDRAELAGRNAGDE
jgi:hypothetical protein